MKKFALVIIAIIVAFSSVYPPEVAHANLVSKPIAIAAKKAAKTAVKDTAVEMANQIVSEFLVRELIEGVKTDDGYSPVCMDGKKNSIKDCPPDKRAQIKTDLSKTDKSNLEKKVESVLEKKTNTSSKWGKFLDIFVPLFLISGAVEIISSALDGDILSFFDEIAQESLIETGLLKPLESSGGVGGSKIYDFTPYVKKIGVSKKLESINVYTTLSLEVIKDFNLTFKNSNSSYRQLNFYAGQTNTIVVRGNGSFDPLPSEEIPTPLQTLAKLTTINDFDFNENPVIWRGPVVPGDTPGDYVMSFGTNYLLTSDFLESQFSVNAILNTLILYVNTADNDMSANVPELDEQIDYGKQTATDRIKDANGKVPLKGINSFTFKYGDTHIYPSGDSQTGWKDKTTGEDITVVEDDVVVDDTGPTDPTNPTNPTDPDDPPDKDKTKKELEDESKKLGNLVTTRFPFSLPWDFVAMVKLLYAEPMTPKWEVKGTEEIPLNFTINLNFLDPYISWFRGFIMVGFVISVIFMHGRFMGGSK